jgi:hypothetical protein
MHEIQMPHGSIADGDLRGANWQYTLERVLRLNGVQARRSTAIPHSSETDAAPASAMKPLARHPCKPGAYRAFPFRDSEGQVKATWRIEQC